MKIFKLISNIISRRDDNIVKSILKKVKLSDGVYVEEDKKSRMDITNYCFIYNISYESVEICVSLKSVKTWFFGLYIDIYTLSIDGTDVDAKMYLIRKLFNLARKKRESLLLS